MYKFCCSCCTNKSYINKQKPERLNSGNNLEINNWKVYILKIVALSWSSLLFQFSETSSLNLILSSLVMLSTMDERRRRLEDAEDSLVPEKQRKWTHSATWQFYLTHLLLIVSAVVPSLWFIIAAVEWSAEVDQLSEDFFQWYSWPAACRDTQHMLSIQLVFNPRDTQK